MCFILQAYTLSWNFMPVVYLSQDKYNSILYNCKKVKIKWGKKTWLFANFK